MISSMSVILALIALTLLVCCSVSAEMPSKGSVHFPAPADTRTVVGSTPSSDRNLISSNDFWGAVLEIAVNIIAGNIDTDDDDSSTGEGTTDLSIAIAQGESKLYGMDFTDVTCSQILGYSVISCVVGAPWEEYNGEDSVAHNYQMSNVWLFKTDGRFGAVLSCKFCLSGGCTSVCVGMNFPAGSLTPSGCAVYIPDEQNPQGPCYDCELCGSSDAGTMGANFDCFGLIPADECYNDPVFNKNPFAYEGGSHDVDPSGDGEDGGHHGGSHYSSYLSILTSLGALLAVAIPLYYVFRRCNCIRDADDNN